MIQILVKSQRGLTVNYLHYYTVTKIVKKIDPSFNALLLLHQSLSQSKTLKVMCPRKYSHIYTLSKYIYNDKMLIKSIKQRSVIGRITNN